MSSKQLWSSGKIKLFEIVLRAGVSATFLGHGFLALGVKAAWIPLITAFGFNYHIAQFMLPVIGAADVLIAIAILVRPIRALVMWTIFWAFLTALSRPLAGESVWEFVEHASNWILPLALLWMKGFPKKWRELWVCGSRPAVN